MLSSDVSMNHGHSSLRAEVPVHLLRPRGIDCIFGRLGHHGHARGHLPGDQHSGGVGDLAVHRPQHAGNGAARLHLQPVLDQLERQRHQKYGGPDTKRHLGPEDLFPAGREPRSGHRPDRLGYEFDSCSDADRHTAADRCSVQRLERSGSTA